MRQEALSLPIRVLTFIRKERGCERWALDLVAVEPATAAKILCLSFFVPLVLYPFAPHPPGDRMASLTLLLQ